MLPNVELDRRVQFQTRGPEGVMVLDKKELVVLSPIDVCDRIIAWLRFLTSSWAPGDFSSH